MYEKLHDKFKSTYSREILEGREAYLVLRDLSATAAPRTQTRREQINVCCTNKSFLNFSTRNFHYIDCFSTSFLYEHSLLLYSHRSRRAIQKRKLKKCTLTISIYAKHIIALCMITIFRNLSSKLRH